MALFKAFGEVTEVTPIPAEKVKRFPLNTAKIIYHHPNQNSVTKDACFCKELVGATISDLDGHWYGCIFCGFTVKATHGTIEVK